MNEFSAGVLSWWVGMSILGLCNVVLWVFAYQKLAARQASLLGDMWTYRRHQWLLAGIYTLGCASRSVVIRSDVKRYSMFDSWITNVMVGRSIATIAEVCFVVQWALLLHLLAKRSSTKSARRLSWVLVPLIVIAEVASWYAVLTTNRLGNVIEESLWTITAGLFLLGLGLCYQKVDAAVQKYLKLGFVALVAYIIFMITIDVPNYYSLWVAAEQQQQVYLTIQQGLQDIQNYKVTGRWDDWRYEMVWMSLYFSLAVWMSIAMIFWPKFAAEKTR